MTQDFARQLGIALKNNDLANEVAAIASGLGGDISFSLSATTSTQAATSAAWTKTVVIKLVDTAGLVHTWLNKAFTTKLSIADTSTAGTATIASTTLTLVDGCAIVVITGPAAAWVATETVTLTVASISLNGNTVASVTHVVTIA